MHSPLISVDVVHSTWPSQAMWPMHAPTFNRWQEEEEEEDTPHIDTWCNARCGLTSLMVCINDKFVI